MDEKKIIYFDMDGVLVDLMKKVNSLPKDYITVYEKMGINKFDIPSLFEDLDPIPGAITAFNKLSESYDCYILTTAPWNNPQSMIEKQKWIIKHLGEKANKRLIITHNKHLNIGDYLIDDRPNNGADKFTGEWIHFGQDKFPDWNSIIEYLM